MTNRPVWVLGDGGQARETRDLIAAVGADETGRRLEFRGFVDELGQDAFLTGQPGGDRPANGVAVALGLGWPGARDHLRGLVAIASGLDLLSLIHPRADVSPSARLGDGVVVSSGCVVTTDVQLGSGTVLNPRCGVGHDSRLGRCCVINPGANISGAVRIGDRVLVGSGATVLQGISIGDDAVVGAGAVVTHDVPAGVTVVGVPAREQRR